MHRRPVRHIAGNPAGQYNGLIGGIADADPEVADTYTVGVVLQPSFIPRLAITVDWFDIKIKNAIQQIGADTILATCDRHRDPAFCGLVHRDAIRLAVAVRRRLRHRPSAQHRRLHDPRHRRRRQLLR